MINAASGESIAKIHLAMHIYICYNKNWGDKMFFFYEKYVAIIGDIVNSKEVKKREIIQREFKDVLADINVRYSKDIASKFTINLGDGFQGLLENKDNIIKIIWEIEMAMAPIELRFGVGIGEIHTDIDYNNSSEIDGPAYHRARRMIQEIESRKTRYTERETNIMVCSEVENNEIDELLNSLLSVCSALKSKWTIRQKEIIYAYLSNDENQYKAAQVLDISQPSVNKSLNNARYYSYKSAMDTVNSFLSRERKEHND